MYRFSYPAEKFDERNLDKNVILTLVRKHEGMVDRLIKNKAYYDGHHVNASGQIVNCEHDAIGNKAIAFVGTSGVQMGWLASQADMLAEDWLVVA